MGVLDNVFGGPNGLVSTMATLFGGTAEVVFVERGAYQVETDSYAESTTRETVPFLPSSGKNSAMTSYPPTQGGFSMAGGLQIEKYDLIGTIPYAALSRTPRVNQDKIVYQDETYSIKDVSYQRVGDVTTGVLISAKR